MEVSTAALGYGGVISGNICTGPLILLYIAGGMSVTAGEM